MKKPPSQRSQMNALLRTAINSKVERFHHCVKQDSEEGNRTAYLFRASPSNAPEAFDSNLDIKQSVLETLRADSRVFKAELRGMMMHTIVIWMK